MLIEASMMAMREGPTWPLCMFSMCAARLTTSCSGSRVHAPNDVAVLVACWRADIQ